MAGAEEPGVDAGSEEDERYGEPVRLRAGNTPFYRHMGMRVTGLGPGWAKFEMPAGRKLWNVGGIVHGGAITSVADAASTLALTTLLEKDEERPVAIELKLNFCSAVVGGTIEASGRVVQKGGRIAVCEADLTEGGRLVARAMSTYMVKRTAG